MPLSAKPMPSSVPGANENLLGNQSGEGAGGGSVIYSPLPEALAASWKKMAVITSRGRHYQSPQVQLHWWEHEKTWYELVRD